MYTGNEVTISKLGLALFIAFLGAGPLLLVYPMNFGSIFHVKMGLNE